MWSERSDATGVPPQVRDNRWKEDDRDTNNGRCKHYRDCRLGDGPDHTGAAAPGTLHCARQTWSHGLVSVCQRTHACARVLVLAFGVCVRASVSEGSHPAPPRSPSCPTPIPLRWFSIALPLRPEACAHARSDGLTRQAGPASQARKCACCRSAPLAPLSCIRATVCVRV